MNLKVFFLGVSLYLACVVDVKARNLGSSSLVTGLEVAWIRSPKGIYLARAVSQLGGIRWSQRRRMFPSAGNLQSSCPSELHGGAIPVEKMTIVLELSCIIERFHSRRQVVYHFDRKVLSFHQDKGHPK